MTVKAFLMLQNISISYKCSLLSPNNKAANQHIRMISEGPSDTEDWSNDAENSALITITFMHLAKAFIQSELQLIQVIQVLSVCFFPGD